MQTGKTTARARTDQDGSAGGDGSWAPGAAAAWGLNRASRAILKLHEVRLKPLGLQVAWLPVLVSLEEQGELTVTQLANIARVEAPSMVQLLARMERDGLITRAANPDDKRSARISLTRKARAKVPAAKAGLLQGEKDATAQLSPRDRSLLIELLQKVARAAEPR